MTKNNAFVSDDEVKATIRRLLAYCQANDWAGVDPYDALNSRLLKALPFLNSRIPRLILTQALKRSPVNLRPMLRIGKTHNPKAIGLFLSALLKLQRVDLLEHENTIELMIQRLIALRSTELPYWCWGYSFPWQTRTIIVPAGAPNLVCTCFVAEALLDAYEQHQDARCLSMAISAAEYILQELYWTDGDRVAGFSYPLRSLRVQVHNANFLGAALLCRVHKHTREDEFLDAALKVARYSAEKQAPDGSWHYGEESSQQWIDNFHTGYNLCALRNISRDAGTSEFDSQIRKGFEFYRRHFFRRNGSVKYFHDRAYPLDIHCVAQSIITLVTFRHLQADCVSLVHSVLRWALDHMWDSRGFFYYRVLRFYKIRTSYMRWSQAWMLLAMSTLLTGSHSEDGSQIKTRLSFVEAC